LDTLSNNEFNKTRKTHKFSETSSETSNKRFFGRKEFSGKIFERINFSSPNRKFFHSLRFKLLVIYLFISVVPLALFSVTISGYIEDYFNKLSTDKYLNQANVLSETLSKEDYFGDVLKRQTIDAGAFRSVISNSVNSGETVALSVLNKNGISVSEYFYPENISIKSGLTSTYFFSVALDALSGVESARVYRDEEAVCAAAPVTSADGVVGAVFIYASVKNNFITISEIDRAVLLTTFFVTAAITVLVFITTKVLMDSVNNLSKVVEKMSKGRLDQRAKASGKDEFAELAKAFNVMADVIESAEKTRDEFVSNVSHELKTPLSSIKILSESILFEKEVPPDVYREFLQDIVSEVDRMATIVNDLLQIVKLDQGETGLNIKNVEINSLIRSILHRLKPIADQREIEVSYDDGDVLVFADVDEVKMTLAISNLIDNAIKYNDKGGAVSVSLAADHQNFFVTVADNGIGISAEEHKKIYDRFYRVEKARDRETGGTGLGLAITYSTVILHNGAIDLVSSENVGSTFTVRVPVSYFGSERGVL
jgi:signal transduction histidine kinase